MNTQFSLGMTIYTLHEKYKDPVSGMPLSFNSCMKRLMFQFDHLTALPALLRRKSHDVTLQ